MKRILTLILISMIGIIPSFGKNKAETITPQENGIKIARNIDSIDIEGTFYFYVTAYIESIPESQYTKPSVKVKIISTKTGRTIWSRRLNGSYLFRFSDGQIQIGKKDLRQIAISKPGNGSAGVIRVKKGIWL